METTPQTTPETKKKSKLPLGVIAAVLVIVLIVVIAVICSSAMKNISTDDDKLMMQREMRYQEAATLLQNGQYDEAYEAYGSISTYENSRDMMREVRYQQASVLLEQGDYEQAYRIFGSLNGYKSSASLMNEARSQQRNEYTVGKTITYGSYNGKALEWEIVARSREQVLLVAKSTVAVTAFGTAGASSWEASALRAWLNSDFLNSAFSATEREAIAETTLSAEGNSHWGISAASSVTDRVFLLSISEVERYLPEESARVLNGQNGEAAWWWLRNPGAFGGDACGVTVSGTVDVNGVSVDTQADVRPAMWLDLKKMYP